eukprot:TRINITY_DN2050_c0_g1_i4.p2 TRINITY_DN2050_c0_g1~~TRINITY_DN2050_c0_g1_i4.p2  ORF type:complete len:107 (+),score=26.05 TRINITY_DN2050_c0_g1_i4:74-394(+)
MDAQTPSYWAAVLHKHLAATGNSKMVVFPDAPHATLASTPVVNSATTCGMQVVASWLQGGFASPSGPDVTCLGHLAQCDWEGTTDATRTASTAFFATPDMWGGSDD